MFLLVQSRLFIFVTAPMQELNFLGLQEIKLKSVPIGSKLIFCCSPQAGRSPFDTLWCHLPSGV